MIIDFCSYELSHQGLCCLTFSLSALHIIFPIDILLKKSKADDKCSLKCGAERVNVYMVDSLFQIVVLYNALNGVIDAPVTTFNSEAIYECNTGYMLEGNGVR